VRRTNFKGEYKEENLILACSRLSDSADKGDLAGSGREKGEVKRACKHCFKNLIQVYQLLVYPLIGYF